MTKAKAVFIPVDGDLDRYDLIVDRRVREYDVDDYDLMGAVSRARLDPRDVEIEDQTGYRTPLAR